MYNLRRRGYNISYQRRNRAYVEGGDLYMCTQSQLDIALKKISEITRILFFRERGCIGKQGEERYKTVTKCAHAYTVGCYLEIDGSIEEGMLA